jgi:hypothetical protein
MMLFCVEGNNKVFLLFQSIQNKLSMRKLLIVLVTCIVGYSASAQRVNKFVMGANIGPLATIRSSITSTVGSTASSPLLRVSPTFGATMQYEFTEKFFVGIGWQKINLDQDIDFGSAVVSDNVTVHFAERNYFKNMWYSAFGGYKLGKRHNFRVGLIGSKLQKSLSSSRTNEIMLLTPPDSTIFVSMVVTSNNSFGVKMPMLKPYFAYSWTCLKSAKGELSLSLQYNPSRVYLPLIDTKTIIHSNNNVEVIKSNVASGSVKFVSCGLQYNYSLR